MEKKSTDAVDTNDTRDCNTKIRSRAWCFTWNNYSENDIKYLENLFTEDKYIFGEEVGTLGTKHLQGAVMFKNPRHFGGVKKILEKCHIEKCISWMASIKYCSKEGKTFSNLENNLFSKKENREEKTQRLLKELNMRLLSKYDNVIWKKWQRIVLNILTTKPDSRKIHWLWNKEGNIGKSFLCNYIDLKYDAIICTGKSTDIFNQAYTWRMNNLEIDQIPPCLIDIPKSESNHKVPYDAIEQLKNGSLYSGKYEGGKVKGESPHIFIFANYAPDISMLSKDRWVIIDLNGESAELNK